MKVKQWEKKKEIQAAGGEHVGNLMVRCVSRMVINFLKELSARTFLVDVYYSFDAFYGSSLSTTKTTTQHAIQERQQAGE